VTRDGTRRPTIADVFDEGAGVYARHWAPVLNRHALDLVAAVPPPSSRQARTVLDVAAGAGTLLPALRPLAGEGGQLVALDYSAGMLARADASVARIQADAARLPLRDACADVAVYAFVLFLLPDARTAVAEAARVTRPGGWLLAATWGTQYDNAADVVVREEIDATGAPLIELPRSDELTDSPHKMRALLEAAGFTDVTTSARPLDARFDIGSVLAMRTGFGSLGWRYARLTPVVQERVVDRAAARLATLPPEAFVDQSEVLLTQARRGHPGGTGG
jgi:ubiquinone/menaquinone biosynthesis C-methylase UbiE